MSYPNGQDGTRKKEITNGNIDALQVLRGRHQPGGLGSRWGMLRPLRGNYGGNFQPWAGRIGVFAPPVGAGAGHATGYKPCVVRSLWYPPLWGPGSRGSVWGALGRCRSFPFSLPFQLYSGGKSRGLLEDGAG